MFLKLNVSNKSLLRLLRPLLVYLFSFLFSPVHATLLLICSSGYLFISKCLKSRNRVFWWRRSLRKLFYAWSLHGSLWHGYEIDGLQNLPQNGPALLVFFHASFFPMDIMYFLSNVFLQRNRLVRAVVDKDAYDKLGLQTLCQCMKVTTGSVNECVKLLKSNQFVAIAPGGLREALFSENYSLLWANRSGFAKVALEARVPIIPIFTVNSQEAMKMPSSFFTRTVRRFYEANRLMCVGPFGWFPVKLKTVVGKPIEFNDAQTVKHLVEQTRKSVESLIVQHQNKSIGLVQAILARFNHLFKSLDLA